VVRDDQRDDTNSAMENGEKIMVCMEVDKVEGDVGPSSLASPPQSPRSSPSTTMLTTTTISSPSEARSASASSFMSNRSDFDEQDDDDDVLTGCHHQCATRLFYVGGGMQSLNNFTENESGQSECLKNQEASSESTLNIEQNSTISELGQSEHSEKQEASPESTLIRKQPISSSSTEEEVKTNLHHPVKRTMITPSNRKQFIADGAMYELVANLAQQAAHSRMCTTFDLEWVTICDESKLGTPVRALVDRDHPLLLQEGGNRMVLRELLGSNDDDEKKEEYHDDDHQLSATPSPENETKSTLLLATGRGKVRAGIFSRHHLLTSGIETGTSWHCIREARLRNWGVAVIDPNARGEEVGYEIFRRSVSKLFDGDSDNDDAAGSCTPGSTSSPSSSLQRQQPKQQRQSHSIYILAHSASGGQLVRHLREDPSLLPSIRAVAFTDSTHNVQWCKHNPHLQAFLQKENCVYLRSNDVRSSQSCVKVSSRRKEIRSCDSVACTKDAGMEVETDHFWRHRFGEIRTLWAGTAEHSLSNWAGHESIWDHFDEQHASSGDGADGVAV